MDPSAESNALPETEGTQPGAPVRKSCAALALLVLAGGAAVLMVWRGWLRRPLPTVPPLPPAPSTIVRPAAVRVFLGRWEKDLQVSCPGRGAWYGVAGEDQRAVALGTGPWLLSANAGRLTFDGAEQPEPEMQLHPIQGAFRLGRRTYRGSLIVRARPDGGLTVLNALAPELYLRSVIGSEMYSNWPLEALMAQAVAARTFMLYSLDAKGYLTEVDMAYRGADAESRSATLAVELTRGIILTYEERLLPAYFHSTCGGATAAVDKVFAEEPIPPLAGVSCQWCRRSPWYQWQAELPTTLLVELFEDKEVRTIRSIAPQGTEPDGYARYVTINEEVRMSAEAFRQAVGPQLIKSARFDVTPQDDRWAFEGRGYGHGVGLCQWGARELARTGKTWQEVLLYYYPGADIQKAY